MPENRPEGSYHQDIQPFLEEGEQNPFFSLSLSRREKGEENGGELTSPSSSGSDTAPQKDEIRRTKPAHFTTPHPLKVRDYLERRLDAGLVRLDRAQASASTPEEVTTKTNLEAD